MQVARIGPIFLAFTVIDNMLVGGWGWTRRTAIREYKKKLGR